MNNLIIILIVLTAVVVSSAFTVFITTRKMRRKLAYMLDALEDRELNFRFDESRWKSRKFNTTLNRLRNIFDNERREIIEQEKYFGLMLDHVRTGVTVVEKDGRVTYSNKTALSLLGIATLGHIRHLRTVSESLYDAFSTIADGTERIADYYNDRGKITISLTASRATIGKESVKIIAFNDITNEIAENEQESWSKLIRVLTHEIMNTITPISSLSDTLMSFEGADHEIRNGLAVISQSSKGLIKFVESYRNLTRVATPVRKVFYLKTLVERVISLTQEQVMINGAVCTYKETSEDIILYADEGQITQIFINLVKNAIQAEARNIIITAQITPSEQTVISVANDGTPISRESRDEIFVPFFTTKQDGTGIGLSLSRQIMRLHNGSLTLTRSDDKETVFTIIFK